MTTTEIQTLIDSNIKTNGTGAITGAVLNNVLTELNESTASLETQIGDINTILNSL